MSNINKQALRQLAEKATPGPWEMEHENIWFRDAEGYTKHLMYAYQGDDVDDQQDHDNTAYIAAFNPKVVLALLDELDAAQHTAAVDHEAACSLVAKNEELKRRIAELEKSRKSWAELAGDIEQMRKQWADSAVEMGRLADEKDKRIAELESRTVKLLATIEKSKEASGCPADVDLQDWVKQLAAENVWLKSAITDHSHSVHFCEVCGKDDPCSTDDVCYALNQTPATDRIYTEAEARGVEKFIASLPSYADTEVDTYDDGVKAAIETTQTVYGPVFIKQLREGNDK